MYAYQTFGNGEPPLLNIQNISMANWLPFTNISPLQYFIMYGKLQTDKLLYQSTLHAIC